MADRANASVPRQPTHVAVVMAGELDRPAGGARAGRRLVRRGAGGPGRARRVGRARGRRRGPGRRDRAPWHPGRCAEILVGPTSLVHWWVTPASCTRPCAPSSSCPAVPARWSWTSTRCRCPARPRPRSLSNFPPALIDVALVVDAGVDAGAVEAALVDGAGPLLESVRLFDVYTGAQVESGQKSLAYKLTLRAPDRTLTARGGGGRPGRRGGRRAVRGSARPCAAPDTRDQVDQEVCRRNRPGPATNLLIVGEG